MSDKAPYEAQYRIETGNEPYQVIDYGVYGKFLKREYNPKYISWLENKLQLAEARFRAAEEVINYLWVTDDKECTLDDETMKIWQQSIKDYEEGVK